MKINTVIFDMDGLLIDSEPLWFEAATEIMQAFGIVLSQEEYNTSTGLRTKEFLHYWFNYFQKDLTNLAEIEKNITELVISKVITKGEAMSGVNHAIQLVQSLGLKIGLASSSPIKLINTVVEKINLKNIFSIITSAEHLPFGKPHPEVFLQCAEKLNSHPIECVCIEDSFNGMIAAKAGRMKCIIVPTPLQFDDNRWHAADLKLKNLSQLNIQNFMTLNK
jgi:HAD superfamily hydrolase (TIGR01509 family)